MFLTELDPSFVGEWSPGCHRILQSIEGAQGLLFFCPKCHNHYIQCWFSNPINATKVPDDISPGPGRWQVSGNNFSNLTLAPSIHLTGPGCGWHGFIQNGQIINA